MLKARISDFKAHLSEYLSKIKAGEEILVTDRGKPVARVIPVKPAEHLPELIRRLERQGLLRVGTARLPKSFWKLPRAEDPEGLILRALLDEREESR